MLAFLTAVPARATRSTGSLSANPLSVGWAITPPGHRDRPSRRGCEFSSIALHDPA